MPSTPNEKSRAYNSAWIRARRVRKRSAGECIYGGCEAPSEGGRQLCRKHAEMTNAKSRAAYASDPQRVRTCGEEGCERILQPRAHLCEEHRAERHIAAVVRANKKTYQRHSEEHRLNLKVRRLYRLANGLCADAEHCGRPVVPGITRCEFHRAKSAANSRKYNATRARE